MCTILETAMGIRFNDVERLKQNYHHAFQKAADLLSHRVLRPWLYPQMIYCITPYYWRQRKFVKILHDFSKTVIQKRKTDFRRSVVNCQNDSKRPSAMLDILLSAKEDGRGIDDEGIREEVDTFVFEVTSLSFT